ncbi:MAG: hypothetical protein IJD73_01060 [Clostridia bacterium]|nr:hypothetical protein [Clostridia bacterium]
MASTQIYEKIVKVKNSKQYAKRISAIMAYALYLAIWIYAGILNPPRSILIFLGGLLSCALIILLTAKYFFLEYEYSFFHSTLSISKIYGKRTRKLLNEADMTELILIAPATEENIARADALEPEKRIIAVSSEQAENIWLCVTGEEDEPRILIFIEADDRSLSILKSCAPHAFVKNL